MSQTPAPTGNRDLEGGGDPVDRRDQPQSTSSQPTPDQPPQPLQGRSESSDYGDSSWPLYSMYSNIAEDEDNKMVERCQKDKDGTLIFIGLFSATVGALLTISIPDLKPNSQDTSAFYLENMYQLFGKLNLDLNGSHPGPSIPSALAKPPAFSPPRYAIWVNSLWFLSLTVSLWGATVATLYRNWAVQYISVTHPPGYTPDKRARIRAIFAKGHPGPNHIWGAGEELIYLHFSLFLFIIGSLIYLFNINRNVFCAVVWWVGYMTISYTGATAAVFSEPHNLFNTPLSLLALRIYLGISYVVFQICSHTSSLRGLRNDTMRCYRDLSHRYRGGLLIGKQAEAREIASKPSSKIDSQILRDILSSLDEDRALETFFDAIPGFCMSKLTTLPLHSRVQRKLRQSLDGFLGRTFSSSLISESVRTGRLITCLNAAHAGLGPDAVSGILDNIFKGHWDEALQSVDIGHALRLWGHSSDYDLDVQRIVACIITRVRRRDDRWTTLVKEVFGVPDHVLRDYLGDSALLSILIHISRQANHAGPGSWTPGILPSLSKLDIHNTLPGLQHNFCSLWNGFAQDARNQVNQGSSSLPTKILRDIRHLYITLHQDTDAVPSAFFASTDDFDQVLLHPSSYPFCNIASHRPSTIPIPVTNSRTIPFPVQVTQPGDLSNAPPHRFLPGGRAALRPGKETNTITAFTGSPWFSDQTAANQIGESSRAFKSTSPVHISPPPTDALPQGAVAAALQNILSTATLSYPPEGKKRRDILPPYAESDINEISCAGPTPKPSPTFTSNSLFPAPHVLDFPVPNSRSLQDPPPQMTNITALLSGTTPLHPITLPRLRERGFVNSENKCFSNAVLQLLAHCPPFWNLFRDLGRLMGQQGPGQGQEAGAGATPLVDANVKFLGGLVCKEELSATQQLQHKALRAEVRENEEGKKMHDVVDAFNPKYLYDAMKENRQLRALLDGEQHDAEEFLGLYLDALDEELLKLRINIVMRQPIPAPSREKLDEEALSGEGQTEVRKRESELRDYTASSAESPISRIFAGMSRSTIRVPGRPDIVTVKSWRSLQLNIQPDSVHSIQDALTHVLQVQPAQVGQSSGSQQVYIEDLPPILVLRLKWLLYDAAADGIDKIGQPVQFAPELEIPPEIMVPVVGKSVDSAHYKLYGVLYQQGESAGSGHYAVDVLHPNGDSDKGEAWLHIDDEAVSVVQHEEMFGSRDNERGEDRSAYMLFYCRTASAGTR